MAKSLISHQEFSLDSDVHVQMGNAIKETLDLNWVFVDLCVYAASCLETHIPKIAGDTKFKISCLYLH